MKSQLASSMISFSDMMCCCCRVSTICACQALRHRECRARETGSTSLCSPDSFSSVWGRRSVSCRCRSGPTRHGQSRRRPAWRWRAGRSAVREQSDPESWGGKGKRVVKDYDATTVKEGVASYLREAIRLAVLPLPLSSTYFVRISSSPLMSWLNDSRSMTRQLTPSGSSAMMLAVRMSSL